MEGKEEVVGIWALGIMESLQTVTKFRDCGVCSLLSAFRIGVNLLMQGQAQETQVLNICKHSLK